MAGDRHRHRHRGDAASGAGHERHNRDRAVPPPDPVAGGEVMPRPQGFLTAGHLYRGIEQGLSDLAGRLGEPVLFVASRGRRPRRAGSAGRSSSRRPTWRRRAPPSTRSSSRVRGRAATGGRRTTAGSSASGTNTSTRRRRTTPSRSSRDTPRPSGSRARAPPTSSTRAHRPGHLHPALRLTPEAVAPQQAAEAGASPSRYPRWPEGGGTMTFASPGVLLAAARVSGEVVPARAQMATTLGFHIILACLGVALPSVVLLAEFIGLRRRDETALRLARRWSQAMGVLVAVGAVTGTVLSFEMGLLWPGLMRRYGAVLGFPFGVEGVFFFLEAIFAGIYLWGWQRLAGWAHWWSGVPIALSGIFGAMSVIAVNSWMNQPGGFTRRGGRIVSVNPWQVYFNRAAIYQMPHMILAAYMVTGFLVAGVYAAGILRGRRDRYHYTGFALGFVPAAVLTPFQIFVGDTAARAIARDQPVKF